VRKRLKPTMSDAGFCTFSANVRYKDFDQNGRLAVSLFY
jgi:hypothetical protein